MLDADEIALLERVAVNTGTPEDKGTVLYVVVHGCAYSCCGRGWTRRDGYEQPYTGYINNFEPPAEGQVGTFMLYSLGLGTISYVCAVRFDEVELVEIARPAARGAVR